MERGGRADGLGVVSEGGGLITLAFNPVAEGDSWYYRSDTFPISLLKMYKLLITSFKALAPDAKLMFDQTIFQDYSRNLG